MKLIDLRTKKQVQKGSVAAGKAPRLDLGVIGISIGQTKSTGDTSKVTEELFHDYVQRLVKDLNIKQLDDGFYSRVFQHPKHKDVVVKVFNDDPDYLSYLKWCQKNQSNPYVPKIIDVVEYNSPVKGKHGSTYHICFMEKLTVMYDVDEVRFMKETGLADFMKETGLADFTDEPKLDFLTYSDLEEAAKEGYFNEHLMAWWKHVKKYGEDRLDLHAGNIMMRKRQFVIIDPVGQGHT